MRGNRSAQIIASTVGLLAVIALVTAAVYWLAPQREFVSTAITCNAIAVATALAAWSGLLFKGEAAERPSRPDRWTDWLALFGLSSLISALFLFIDCGWHLPLALGGRECDGHPGITLALTIGVVALTAIALPSALRAWLLEHLSSQGSTSSEA